MFYYSNSDQATAIAVTIIRGDLNSGELYTTYNMCLRNYKHNIELLYIDGTRILFNWRRMENPVATIPPLSSSSDDSAFIIMHLRHSPGWLLKKFKLNLSLCRSLKWIESYSRLDHMYYERILLRCGWQR